MASPSLDKVERAFHAAVAARESGHPIDLGLLCDGDESVANEVRNLLKHLDEAGTDDRSFLSPSELHAERQPSRIDGGGESDHEKEWGISAVGQRVGEFTIIGELGAGGMGVVFVAAQDNPQRTVALKLIRRAIATKTMVRRFEREAQLLGRLNHPGIAQVYAAGVAEVTDAHGAQVRAPFIAMELVEGPTILEYVRKHRDQSPQLAIQLIAQACDAIEHAHLRGVIHRDLKPANILIANDTQAQPQVKVLDFGVARQADDEPSRTGSPQPSVAEATTRLTFHGHLVGTLAYMSPEQFNTMREADVRSDVYALGAILYQLLSGQHAIDVSDCSLLEAARRISEVEPKWLGTIDSTLRGDVETIVAKTLEKEPSRRYQSPAELARDLRHHLEGEPIEARRDSMMYVLRKRAAQYRALAVVAFSFLVLAVAVAIYTRQQEHQQQRVAEVALAAQEEAEEARRRADETSENLAKELSASRLAEGRLLGDSGDLAGAERLLWDELIYRKYKSPARWAVWELYVHSGCANTVAAHAGECQDVALAPDGRAFATCGEDRFVRIWSLPDGRRLAEHESGVSNGRAIAFTRDGAELIVTGPEGAMLIDVKSGARRALPGAKDSYGIDVSSDGAMIAIGNNDGSVRLYDRNSGKEILLVQRDEVVSARRRGARGVCFNSSMTRLAAAYDDGDVRLFNLTINGGHPTYTPGPEIGGHPSGGAQCVRFSPDGSTLVSGGTDRNIKLWRASDGSAIASTPTANGTARAIAFGADGNSFAVPGYWQSKFFDAKTGDPIPPPQNRLALGAGGSYGACFTPDGDYLLTAQEDGACRIWRLTGQPFVALPSTRATVRDLAIAHVGEDCVIATAQTDGTVRVRAAPITAPLMSEWRDVMRCDAGDALRCMTMNADASRLIVGRADGRVIVLDGRDGRVIQEIEAHGGTVNMCRLTPNEQLLVTSSTDRTAKIWRRVSNRETWELATTLDVEGDCIGVAIHPQGNMLVTTNRPTHIRFWTLRADGSCKLLQKFTTNWSMWKPAFNRAGDRLAVGAWDRSLMIWQTNSPAPTHQLSLMGHTQLPVAVAFDESNRLLASASNDGTLRVWDIQRPIDADEKATGPVVDRRRCFATLDAKAGDAMCVAFLPTNPRTMTGSSKIEVGQSVVAVGYSDGNVRLWDLQYFHEAIMRNDLYQRQLRGLDESGTVPATAQSPR